MSVQRIATILLTTLATIVGLLMFFLAIVAIARGAAGNFVLYLAIFVLCLWYVTRVMRADRRQRLAEEAQLPPERRPVKREPRRPVTFQLRETGTAFAIWAIVVGAIGIATGLPSPVVVGMAVFAGFMLATLTVTGRHMMFRLTAEEDEANRGE